MPPRVRIIDRSKEAAERLAAIQEAMSKLAKPAREFGGRYRVYGSAARGDTHWMSDLDVMLEFPLETINAAEKAAYEICEKAGVPCDIAYPGWQGEEFMRRVRAESVCIR